MLNVLRNCSGFLAFRVVELGGDILYIVLVKASYDFEIAFVKVFLTVLVNRVLP